MASYGKYQKNPVIVSAMQLDEDIDLGCVGTGVCGDYMLYLVNGDLHLMCSDDFALNYQRVSDESPLTGTNWD